MNAIRNIPAGKPNARAKLLDAAIKLVRHSGFSATSVDQICAEAKVTKGAFFHHFASKEALGAAAAKAWTERAEQLIFTLPEWTRMPDPLDRLLTHIDFRAAMIEGSAEDFTCFVGTMVQESFASSDILREASDASLTAYAERLAEDIEAAIDQHGIVNNIAGGGISALSLAYHVQAVLQGAFILAKAKGSPEIARDNIRHLKHYVSLLFGKETGS
ncbi:TetR/AcrR family transcriptional regulator [uncultured Parasphingorhabdus sp.]|uniref:TetR/AcrR family transcriptional regulator n=1 Tax=uncultured Parasphingorhabdus sp. TaxID=2709694 RepID=UPI0030DDA464|tara:strand:- start:32306 stop:32953 length:648 start_codon:yes stop_codon:yes gene_type:complete